MVGRAISNSRSVIADYPTSNTTALAHPLVCCCTNCFCTCTLVTFLALVWAQVCLHYYLQNTPCITCLQGNNDDNEVDVTGVCCMVRRDIGIILCYFCSLQRIQAQNERNDIKQQNRQTLGPSGVGRNNTVVWSSWRGYDRLVISLIYSSSTVREQYYLFGVQFLGHLMKASSILLSFSPEFDVYGGWIFTGLSFSVPIFG